MRVGIDKSKHCCEQRSAEHSLGLIQGKLQGRLSGEEARKA
jgi:hypothetical protein